MRRTSDKALTRDEDKEINKEGPMLRNRHVRA